MKISGFWGAVKIFDWRNDQHVKFARSGEKIFVAHAVRGGVEEVHSIAVWIFFHNDEMGGAGDSPDGLDVKNIR